MAKQMRLSAKTRQNWLIDAAVFLGGILAALSGIYFLFLPSGGYQGGRNPFYGVTILFSRHTWETLHTWTGIVMIGAAAIHLAIHWSWVVMMSKRVMSALRSGQGKLSKGARFNVAVDALVAASGFVTAVSGIYFLFVPPGSQGAGHNVTWDLIHTWAGVVLIAAAVVHLAIHWRWVKNVTLRLVASLWAQPQLAEAQAQG